MTTRDEDDFELDEATPESGPKALREARDRALSAEKEANQRAAEAEAKLMVTSVRAAGLDPTKGVGKALVRTYEGEPDVDQIIAYAQSEYDWQPANPHVNAMAQVTANTAARMEAGAQGASPGSVSFDDAILEAQKAGRWDEVTRLEVEKFIANQR